MVCMQFYSEFEVSTVVKEVYSFVTNTERITTIIPDMISLQEVNENCVRLVTRAGKSFIKVKFNPIFEIKDLRASEPVEISARGSGPRGLPALMQTIHQNRGLAGRQRFIGLWT